MLVMLFCVWWQTCYRCLYMQQCSDVGDIVVVGNAVVFYDRLVIDGCISILMLVTMLLLLCKWQTSYRCRCYDVDNVVVVGGGYIVLVVGCVVMLVTDLLQMLGVVF